MKIAIIGAGLSGLATCYYLLERGAEVTLFDSGKSASRVATGLMHPYPGKQCRRSWMADEAIAESLKLMEQAGVKPIKGIIRIARSEEQARALESYDDVKPLGEGRFEITSGYSVDVGHYLDGLLKACLEKGAKLEKKVIHSLTELEAFDAIVIAAGAGTVDLYQTDRLKMTKGQVLICEGEIPKGVIAEGYIAPSSEAGTFQFGSTYEHEFEDDQPNLDEAKQQLEKKFHAYEEMVGPLKPISCKAGIRVMQKGEYRPLMEQVDAHTWLLTGMGSRGLLYHAYFGKLLAKEIMSQ